MSTARVLRFPADAALPYHGEGKERFGHIWYAEGFNVEEVSARLRYDRINLLGRP